MAGYLSEAQSRAGDVVKAGQLMATLDDRDLRLERLKWATQRAKQQREYSEALAKQELAKAQVLRTQIEQADAQLTLVDEQISRLRITAPFNGIVVSGDLSQQLDQLPAVLVGRSVHRRFAVVIDCVDIGAQIEQQSGRLDRFVFGASRFVAVAEGPHAGSR